tara:strand:- start:4887 stop:5525 length:639 start_codon:yes stop_codon:yes gene_type:complete
MESDIFEDLDHFQPMCIKTWIDGIEIKTNSSFFGSDYLTKQRSYFQGIRNKVAHDSIWNLYEVSTVEGSDFDLSYSLSPTKLSSDKTLKELIFGLADLIAQKCCPQLYLEAIRQIVNKIRQTYLDFIDIILNRIKGVFDLTSLMIQCKSRTWKEETYQIFRSRTFYRIRGQMSDDDSHILGLNSISAVINFIQVLKCIINEKKHKKYLFSSG